ncbi:hypothetical protein V8E55_001398 [Tylopilus felleus]
MRMVIFIFFLIRHANPIPPPLFRCRLDVNNVSTTCDHHLSCFHWRVISSTTSLDRLMAEPDHIEPATFELSYHGNHPTYSLTAPIHRLRAGPSSTQLVVHIQYNMANGTPPQQKVPQRFISPYIRQHHSKSARIGRSHFHTHTTHCRNWFQITASACRDRHNFAELTIQSVSPSPEARAQL